MAAPALTGNRQQIKGRKFAFRPFFGHSTKGAIPVIKHKLFVNFSGTTSDRRLETGAA